MNVDEETTKLVQERFATRVAKNIHQSKKIIVKDFYKSLVLNSTDRIRTLVEKQLVSEESAPENLDETMETQRTDAEVFHTPANEEDTDMNLINE